VLAKLEPESASKKLAINTVVGLKLSSKLESEGFKINNPLACVHNGFVCIVLSSKKDNKEKETAVKDSSTVATATVLEEDFSNLPSLIGEDDSFFQRLTNVPAKSRISNTCQEGRQIKVIDFYIILIFCF